MCLERRRRRPLLGDKLLVDEMKRLNKYDFFAPFFGRLLAEKIEEHCMGLFRQLDLIRPAPRVTE